MADGAPRAVEDCHALLRLVIPHLDKFPRQRRFTLGDRIETALLDVLKSLVAATYSRDNRPDRRFALRPVTVTLSTLDGTTDFLPVGWLGAQRISSMPDQIRRSALKPMYRHAGVSLQAEPNPSNGSAVSGAKGNRINNGWRENPAVQFAGVPSLMWVLTSWTPSPSCSSL